MTTIIPGNSGLPVPQRSEEVLELPQEEFFRRMTGDEGEAVRHMARDVAQYMDAKTQGRFLIAGVGGILRRRDPHAAEDIDLAAVGLKYTSHGHDFGHVRAFTVDVIDYFDNLVDALRAKGEGFAAYRIRDGTGPFAYSQVGVEGTLNDLVVNARTHINSFQNNDMHPYGSKGLSIQFGAMKPIDIQFVFNATVPEWLAKQAEMRDPYAPRNGKIEAFPYTILERPAPKIE